MKRFTFGLLEAFLLFVVLLFAMDTTLHYHTYTTTAREISEQIMDQTAKAVHGEVERFQNAAEFLLGRTREFVRSGEIDFTDPASANGFFMGHLRWYGDITSVNFGDSQGNGYLLLRERGRWRNRIKIADRPGVVTWQELNERGGVRSRTEARDDYDPRQRPWYRLAAEAAEVRWSKPYIFRTTRDPGITASLRVDDGRGPVQVVGADILLKDLSVFLQDLTRDAPELELAVVSRSGRVLASSRAEEFNKHLVKDDPDLPRTSDPGFERLRDALDAPVTGAAGLATVSSDNRTYFALRVPFRVPAEEELAVLMLIPRESLLGNFARENRVRIALFFAVLLLSSAYFVRRFLMPVRRLTRAVRSMEAETYVPLPPEKRNDEVGVLVNEFGRMAESLLQKQRTLAESEERYRTLFDTVSDGVFRVDANGRITRVNRAFAGLFGFGSPEELEGTLMRDRWHPPEARDVFLAELSVRRTISAHRFRAKKQDGTVFVAEVSSVYLQDGEGEFLGTEGILRDATERVLAEEALRSAAETWRGTFDAMSDLVSVHDNEHRVIRANRAMAEFFGMDAAELIGKKCHELFHGSDAVHEPCPFRRTLAAGRTASEEIDDPHVGVPLQITTSPLFGADGTVTGCVHVARDLSEQRALEEQLRQSQKLEAVGRLAGGVAHDFNNILSAIIGYANLAQARILPDDPARRSIDEVIAAAERAAKLTRDLLAFGRRQDVAAGPLDLNEVVRGMRGLLERLAGEEVRLEIGTDGSALPVIADAGQLEQVLMNLAVNARDALSAGGVITVRTGRMVMDEAFVRSRGFGAPGGYAVVAVADDGAGMDEATRQRIFEPFFTTKERGKGTGLGLAIVYGIMAQHRGHVTCESEPGEGAVFTVYLPLSGAVPPAGPPPAEEERSPAGTETILVAEDDEMLRRLAETVLTEKGYRVILAADGEEAVRRFSEHADEVALVLLDVIMPRKDGKRACDEIRALRPGVPALFISGYTDDVIGERGIGSDGIELITKPVTPQALLSRIRAVLDSRPSR